LFNHEYDCRDQIGPYEVLLAIITKKTYEKEKGEKLSGERKDNSLSCKIHEKALAQVELCH